ncbi:MAG TPA: hypothetical protein VGE76_00775 [Opitutaceae bacterium]
MKTLLLAALLAPTLAVCAPSKLSPPPDKAIALQAEKAPSKQKGPTTPPAPEKPAPRPTRPAHLFM